MKVRSPRKFKDQPIVRNVAIALILLVVGVAAPVVFSAAARFVLTPVHVFNQWLTESSDTFPSYIRERTALYEEIKNLKNELAIAGRSNITTERLYEENLRLRSLLHASTSPRIGAAVVARPDTLPYDLLQIDQGSEAGVTVGSPVYIGSDWVIGLVKSVAPKYAFVELLTTPGFSSTVYIAGANVIATMEGYGGGVARVRVPQGVPLQSGNLVHIPSIEPGIFGRVSHVENTPSQPEQFGYITPEIPIQSIFFVAVAPHVPITTDGELIKAHIEDLLIKNLSLGDTGTTTTATSTVANTTASTTATENQP
ncbi:MAG: rod shape-determining protein MreC [Patescibacteria group bacterium]